MSRFGKASLAGGGRPPDVASRRALKATALLACAVVAVALSGGPLGSPEPSEDSEPPETSVRDLVEGDAELAGPSALPRWLTRDAPSSLRARDVAVDEPLGLAGFTLPGDARSAFRLLSDELRESGWDAVDSGIDGCGTFSRGEGGVRWASVACCQVGGEASVVVAYR